MKRPNGHYWVNKNGRWIVAEYDSNYGWYIPGREEVYEMNEFNLISNNPIIEPTAEANANTVLCGVAAIDDLKCCGNCINSRHYTNLVIPESIFCCAVSAHRIKPHNMCEYWKQDNYESEQRNIDKPKP